MPDFTKVGAAALVALTFASVTALAETAAEYPSRPITFIIGYSPGGGTDVSIRTWTPYVEKCLGNGATIVHMNKPGANGEVSWGELSTTEPDGYTLAATNLPTLPLTTITKNNTVFSLDSFDYVANMTGSQSTLSVSKDGPFKTFDDFLKTARERTVNVAVSSLGGDDFVKAMQILITYPDLKLNFVPMGDGASSRSALLGGHIDVAGLSVTEVTPFLDELRVLAVAAPEPRADLTDVPTYKSLGLDIVGGSTHIISSRAGLPADIKAKLSDCFMQVAKDPAYLAEAAKRNMVMMPMDSEQARAWVMSETETLKKLWKDHPW